MRVLGVVAEDHAHDRGERNRLHLLLEAQPLTRFPVREPLLRDLTDLVDELRSHGMAPKPRQQDLALLHVRVAVEEQDRVGPDDGTEEPVGVARRERRPGSPAITSLASRGSADHRHVRARP